MRPLIYWLLLLALAGCQRPYLDAHLELMNSERRQLEDELLDLQTEFERQERKLVRCEAENDQLRESAGLPAGAPSGRQRRSPAVREDELQVPDIVIPEIDPGVPVEPGSELPGPANRRQKTPPPDEPESEPADSSAQATQLYIHPRLTRGRDVDGLPGDDGLTIVLQPRNARGQFVPQSGPVTIVLLDHALRGEGDAARVARWDLDQEEIAARIDDSAASPGIELELAWPERPPSHPHLQLHVRLTTPDGRPLDAQRDLLIDLPGAVTRHWTPRPSTASRSEPPGQPVWQPYR